jgi:hypothetical protein
MLMRRILIAVVMLVLPAAAVAAVTGNYLEARTSDVFTGPCVANSEVNLQGKQAVLAWHVAEGEWDGVRLDGLSVVAVVRASATLGDPFATPWPVRSVLVVDERATPGQRDALVSLAKDLAGNLLDGALAVEVASVKTRFDRAAGEAHVVAGDLAEVRTRPLCHHDRHCGNEEVYYPPLTDVPDAVPAVAVAHSYRGAWLGGTWSSPGKRSAFVGTFAR